MVLQEQEQRRLHAALGKTGGAAVAGHAACGKQLRRRFAFIDVLRLRRCSQPAKAGEPDEALAELLQHSRFVFDDKQLHDANHLYEPTRSSKHKTAGRREEQPERKFTHR